MEFDNSKVYTALNADELEIGSKVAVANDLAHLKVFVRNDFICMLEKVLDEESTCRFVANDGAPYSLAYLVSEPDKKKLEWTDLKVGDVIRHKESGVEYLITGIDKRDKGRHCYFADTWCSDSYLEEYEKVEV